jgi:hypothetical protein
VIVVGAREERRELDTLQLSFESFQTGVELPGELRIRFVLEELVGRLDIAQGSLESLVSIDLILETSEALGQLLAASRVVPERGVRRVTLRVDELRALASDVKGTPWRPGCDRGGSGPVRCDRSWDRL